MFILLAFLQREETELSYCLFSENSGPSKQWYILHLLYEKILFLKNRS